MRVNALAEFNGDAAALYVGNAAGYLVAFLVLGDVFVDAVGMQLFQTQPKAALFAIVLEHDGAHNLADFNSSWG